MTTQQNATATDLELTITRVFDAPRELVWKAWTEAEHWQQWMGPADFTCPEFDMDLRPGGKWHTRITGPGEDYTSRGTVVDVTPPERLVLTFAWDDPDGAPGREMRITVTLRSLGNGQTEMTFHQATFESAEDRDNHRGGWTQSFDKLASYLAAA